MMTVEHVEKCKGCGEMVDPDICWCGQSIDHGYDNHTATPMGCNCYRMEISHATQEGDMLILTTDTPIETPEGWHCKHNRTGYCFDCVRERHNQEVLDGKYDDIEDDYIDCNLPTNPTTNKV